MIEIKLIHTHFTEPLDDGLYDYYLAFLPKDLQIKNGQYRRWQDRHTHLFGKIFLIHLANKLGLDGAVLEKLQYTDHNRPFLVGSTDFNISHTGATVACAMVHGAKIGLDIEDYSEVDFADFPKIHNEELWEKIRCSEDPQAAFFDCWTTKESVIKADGKGLSIPLNEIVVEENRAQIGVQEWYTQRLRLYENMSCCLACNQSDFKVVIEKITQKYIYARGIC